MRRRTFIAGSATSALFTATVSGSNSSGDAQPATLTSRSPRETVEVLARGTAEGVISLSMAAPGNDWASSDATSVTVDVSVGDAPPQQTVLYSGAQTAT